MSDNIIDSQVLVAKELQKCKDNPYYFATRYITVVSDSGIRKPYSTLLSEEEFNKFVNEWNENNKLIIKEKEV